MAIPFELWVECESPTHAEQVVPHFHGLRHTLVTGRAVTWHAAVDFENALVVGVEPLGLNRFGIATEGDRVEQEESALRLYHRLLTAPAFRYAHAARQAHLTPLEEFLWDSGGGAEGDQGALDFECVVDDGVWARLGQPSDWRPFRPGYWTTISWDLWRGRQWLGLLGGGRHPELLGLCREVLGAEPSAPEAAAARAREGAK
jgi:hypothetical protein